MFLCSFPLQRLLQTRPLQRPKFWLDMKRAPTYSPQVHYSLKIVSKHPSHPIIMPHANALYSA
jgi:hypothetical protein